MYDPARVRRQWYFNRQRALEAKVESTLTLRQWIDITIRADGVCAYCKHRVGAAYLSMDHVIPLSKGGAHSADNIVAACLRCNSLKNAQGPEVMVDAKPYPIVQRTPEHYYLFKLSIIFGMSVESVKTHLRAEDVEPLGVSHTDARTLLYDRTAYDRIKRRRELMLVFYEQTGDLPTGSKWRQFAQEHKERSDATQT